MPLTRLNYLQASPRNTVLVMTGNLFLTRQSEEIQHLDTNGSPRAVFLPDIAVPCTQDKYFKLFNRGPELIFLFEQNPSVFLNIIMSTGSVVEAYADGTDWNIVVVN